MTLAPDEFRPCESPDGCTLAHDHALHGGKAEWPLTPYYEQLRRRSLPFVRHEPRHGDEGGVAR
jgi:hypothetical protein